MPLKRGSSRKTEVGVEQATETMMKIARALDGYNQGEQIIFVLTYLDVMSDDERHGDIMWTYVREAIDVHLRDGIRWQDLMPDGDAFPDLVRCVRESINGEQAAV